MMPDDSTQQNADSTAVNHNKNKKSRLDGGDFVDDTDASSSLSPGTDEDVVEFDHQESTHHRLQQQARVQRYSSIIRSSSWFEVTTKSDHNKINNKGQQDTAATIPAIVASWADVAAAPHANSRVLTIQSPHNLVFNIRGGAKQQ
eukprot:GEZU01007716.1.p1 GENE.GEZU01007716.1~~GEZU01007716.1.p1  ORF type:complete len:145 (-),score=38.28 GEZU01007716.1:314-748(-)